MKGNDPYLFTCLDVVMDQLPHGGAYNMALDEVLLQGHLVRPLLRLYRWVKPAVSFGYFEGWQAVAAEFPTYDLVRRWTGGGVVEHRLDWTYSLLLPRTEPATNLPAGESYRLIHNVLRQALLAVGYAEVILCSDPKDVPANRAHACFVEPVHHDLLWDGRKISGAAQRRTRRGLLHQGSVQNVVLAKETADSLDRILPSLLAPSLQHRELHGDEDIAADHLATNKYATSEWLRRV